MATDQELRDAASAGLLGGLQHESVQENDRELKFPDPEKLLNLGGKLDRQESANGRKYGGPRRLRASFADSDR